MKKLLFSVFLLLPAIVHSCTGVVIAFKGKNDMFDNAAFKDYHNSINYCGIAYSWQDGAKALTVIKTLQVPYQLYGFSQGASTVSNILKQTKTKPPEYTITIGAYKTANVDFTKYGIAFDNYFDFSGHGQKSPGIHLNVAHMKMQAAVNTRRVGIVAVP